MLDAVCLPCLSDLILSIFEQIRIHRQKPRIYFFLNQESGFDNLAALGLDLDRIGTPYVFLWPFDEGPIQGNFSVAAKLRSKWGFLGPLLRIKSLRHLKSIKRQILRNNGIVFIQTPYLFDHYVDSSIDLLKGVRLGYLNYGVNLADTPDYHYELDTYKSISTLLVANEFEKEAFIAAGINPENILVVGIPVVHELIHFIDKTAPDSNAPLKLLWAPYWAGTWSNWEKTLRPLYTLAKGNSDIEIKVRAHPLLTPITSREVPSAYQTAKASSENSEFLFQQLLALPNVEISQDTIVADCRIHDLLLTDGVSIIAFWAATGKNQGVIRRATSPDFSSQYLEINENVHHLDIDTPQVENWITENLELHHRNELAKTNHSSSPSTWFSPKTQGPGLIFKEWLRDH